MGEGSVFLARELKYWSYKLEALRIDDASAFTSFEYGFVGVESMLSNQILLSIWTISRSRLD